MSIDRPNKLPSGSPLKSALKAKSRRRRKSFEQVSNAPPPRPSRNDVLPQLGLVFRRVNDLSYPPRNVRSVDAAQVRDVASSISAFGACIPVIIDGQNVVVDGVVRVEAAKLVGLPEIPCIVVSHLTDPERRLLRITLNRLQEKGTWDIETLKLEFETLILENAPIEVSGFSWTEIDQIMIGDEAPVAEVGPLEPDPAAAPVAKLGDMFRLGCHVVICGDSTSADVMARLMGDDAASLILTDQPYNVPIVGNVTRGDHREFPMASGEMSASEFLAFNSAWMRNVLPYLCDGGLFATFIDWRGFPSVHASAVGQGLTPINLVVWTKTGAGMGSLYRSQHELLPLFKKGAAAHTNNVLLGKHGRSRSNVWTYPGAATIGSEARRGLQDHPTVKPVAMLEDAILDVTKRNDIVVDPFLGSGSTLIAAEKTGRRCCGVELDPRYVDVIIRRYEAVTGHVAQLVA